MYPIFGNNLWILYVPFLRYFAVPISWIFPEHPDIRWQVAVEDSLLSVYGISG